MSYHARWLHLVWVGGYNLPCKLLKENLPSIYFDSRYRKSFPFSGQSSLQSFMKVLRYRRGGGGGREGGGYSEVHSVHCPGPDISFVKTHLLIDIRIEYFSSKALKLNAKKVYLYSSDTKWCHTRCITVSEYVLCSLSGNRSACIKGERC